MPPANIRLVIFDLDGTLVDAYRAVSKSLNSALKDMGYQTIPYQVVKRRVGWGEKILVGNFVEEKDIEETLKLYRINHKRDLPKYTKFLPGARDLLKQLYSQGYQLAIASNRPTFFTEAILKLLKIRKYFRYVVCADRVKCPKPSADILKYILKRSTLKPQDVLYVGDMAIDVQTGRNAKVITIAVATGSSTRQELSRMRPFRIINRISLLGPILNASVTGMFIPNLKVAK